MKLNSHSTPEMSVVTYINFVNGINYRFYQDAYILCVTFTGTVNTRRHAMPAAK
jgi:hypothetical protein